MYVWIMRIVAPVIILTLLLASRGNAVRCPSLSHCADCDALPGDGNILCSIDNNQMGIVACYYERCAPIFMSPTQPCQVYVGMRVTLQCNITELALFHNGEPTGSFGSLTIPYVQQKHEGVYDCRVVMDGIDFNMTMAERSLVVRRQTQVAPGPDSYNACTDSYECDGENMCCRACVSFVTPSRSDTTSGIDGVFQYYIFGEDPLDVTIETIWLSDTHPVDLQIEWERNTSTSLLSGTIGQWPETINRGGTTPTALLRITANNTLGLASTCFRFEFFDSSPRLAANTSLPSNQTVREGEEAVFLCGVGTSGSGCPSTQVVIEYIPPSRTNSSLVSCCLESSYECRSTEGIEITKTSQNAFLTLFSDIEVRIPSVDITDDGSAVSCALMRGDVIHWRREAYLTVVPKDPSISLFPRPGQGSSLLSSSLLVSTSVPEPSVLVESANARDVSAAGTYAGVGCGLFVLLVTIALVITVTCFLIRRRASKITADKILVAREKKTAVDLSIPVEVLPSIHKTSEQHGNNYSTIKQSQTCSRGSALHSTSPT